MRIVSLHQLKSSATDGKKLIVFDLDGTLAPTKAPMDREMAGLIKRLLMKYKVAVIGGGRYSIFQYQFIKRLRCPKELLTNLFLFPVTSTSFYRFHHGWKQVYAHNLTKSEKTKIKMAFARVLKQINYQPPKKIYGKVLEDRGSQITWSAVGQDVVKILGRKKGVALKEQWKQQHTPLKLKIAKLLSKLLPEFEIHAAGYTSIDVTKKGIDKAYGLRQIERHLKIKIRDMLFVGDAIFKGGNDYAVVKTGVDYVKVKGPQDTKKIICLLLSLRA